MTVQKGEHPRNTSMAAIYVCEVVLLTKYRQSGRRVGGQLNRVLADGPSIPDLVHKSPTFPNLNKIKRVRNRTGMCEIGHARRLKSTLQSDLVHLSSRV